MTSWNCVVGGSICNYLVVTAIFLGRKWCSTLSFWCSCPPQPQASSMLGKHSTHWVPSQVPAGFFGEYLWFKPWALLTQLWSFKYFKVLLLGSFKHFNHPVPKENKRIRIFWVSLHKLLPAHSHPVHLHHPSQMRHKHRPGSPDMKTPCL